MASDPNHTFGDLLRHYRLAANLTQEHLAERAGISPQAITTLERGTRHSPRKATLQRLLDALRLTGAERALLESAACSAAPARVRRTPSPDCLPSAPRSTPLVGRVEELTALRRHLDGTGPAALVLAGEPGIGKSRLLAQAHVLATEPHWRVLAAGCHRGSATLPYAPLLDAFRQHLNARSPAGRCADLRGCSWLVRLLPELDDLAAVPASSWSLPAEQERRLMFDAARRTLLHLRLAEAYVRQPGAPPLEALAYHFARSGDDERALDYIERAGDHARMLQAHTTAQGHYQRLVVMLDRLDRAHAAALAREKLGAELAAQAHYAEALEVLERASAIYEHAGEHDELLRVVAQIGNTHARRGTPTMGLASVGALLTAEPSATPSHSLARLYEAQAHLHFVAGQYAAELDAAEQLTHLARILNDTQLVMAAEYWRSDALDALGHHDQALAALSALIVHPASAAHPWNLAHMLNKLAYIYQRRGEFTNSTGYHERALAVARQFGDPTVISHMLVMLGMNRFYVGDWELGRSHVEEALDHIRQLGPTFRTSYPLLACGLICQARGECVAALAFLEEARTSGARNGDIQALRFTQRALAEHDLLEGRPAQAQARLEPLLDRPGQRETLVTFVLPPLAWACLDLDDISRAEALLRDGGQRADEQQFRVAQVEMLQVRVLLETRRHNWHAATRAAHESLDLCRAMPYPHGEVKALYGWGVMHIAQGKPTLAHKRLEAGLAISQRLGERLYGERIERTLAHLDNS